MSFVVIIASIIGLILLISYLKIDAFIAFIIVSLLAGIALGIPIDQVPTTINHGVGSIMESLTLIIIFGAMLGKLEQPDELPLSWWALSAPNTSNGA